MTGDPGAPPAFTLEDVAYLLHPLVPLRAMAAAARARGRLQYLARPDERRRVGVNLASAGVHGRRDLALMTRQAFEYRDLRSLLLTLHPRMTTAQAARLFPFEGLEHLERARAEHGGVVLACSHVNSRGNMIAVERLRSVGFDIRTVLPTAAEAFPLSRFRRRLYRRTGGQTFAQRIGGFHAQFNLRPIVRRLSEGTTVLIVADGWHSAGFVETTFLGRPAQFTTGAVSVARVAGTVAVPLFVAGRPPDRLRFVLEEPIAPDPAADARADVERMVSEYARRVERRLLDDLPCWEHWFEDRTLETMQRLTEIPLSERYRIGGAG